MFMAIFVGFVKRRVILIREFSARFADRTWPPSKRSKCAKLSSNSSSLGQPSLGTSESLRRLKVWGTGSTMIEAEGTMTDESAGNRDHSSPDSQPSRPLWLQGLIGMTLAAGVLALLWYLLLRV